MELSEELELEISKIDNDEVIDAWVVMDNNHATKYVKIAMFETAYDDGVFYHCTDKNDFRALLRDQNAGFKVVAFSGYKAKYPRVSAPYPM
jgi:hypothetical protein